MCAHQNKKLYILYTPIKLISPPVYAACTQASISKHTHTHTRISRSKVYSLQTTRYCLFIIIVYTYRRETRTPHKFDASNSWVLIRLVSPHPVRVIVFFLFFFFIRPRFSPIILYYIVQRIHIYSYTVPMNFPKSMSAHKQWARNKSLKSFMQNHIFIYIYCF